jgi:adenine-specific DNA methylase
VTYYIEHDFPIEQLNPLAQREAEPAASRPYEQLHKWWARRLGCVFRTMILASLIPEEEWRRLDEEVQRADIDVWTALYYREHPKANPLIEKYLKDKVVLDPFMGGGTTIVEALRLGCKVIGVDVNPVAWFVVKKSIEPVDLEALDTAFERLKEEVAPDILKYYRTPCPFPLSSPSNFGRGEGGQGGEVRAHLADVMYVFWVKKVQCTNCGRNTRLFSSFRLATKKGKDIVVCPHCYWVGEVKAGTRSVVCPDCGQEFHPRKGWASEGKFTCEHCGHVDQTVEWVRRTGRAPEYEMFALEYWCSRHGRGYKGVEDFDKELYRKACHEFEKEKASLPLPEGDIPAEGRSDPRPISFGMTRWTDLFNPRQLLCLGRLIKAVQQIDGEKIREIMVLTVSEATAANCLLARYKGSSTQLIPLFSVKAYWVPNQPLENNVWGTAYGSRAFKGTYEKVRKGLDWLQSPWERVLLNTGEQAKVAANDSAFAEPSASFNKFLEKGQAFLTTRSAEDLSFIPSRSVDAVITDPPYYSNECAVCRII